MDNAKFRYLKHFGSALMIFVGFRTLLEQAFDITILTGQKWEGYSSKETFFENSECFLGLLLILFGILLIIKNPSCSCVCNCKTLDMGSRHD